MRVFSSDIRAHHADLDRAARGNFHRQRSGAGITVVELLVVIAVITILMALLLPAVQYSREMARRFSCQNNLHQLGLALHQYHDTHSAFPPGCLGDEAHKVNMQAWGWGVLILPYLEQRPVYDRLRPDVNSLTDALKSATQQQALREPLRVFRCPSDSSEWHAHPYHLIEGVLLAAPSATPFVLSRPPHRRLVNKGAAGGAVPPRTPARPPG